MRWQSGGSTATGEAFQGLFQAEPYLVGQCRGMIGIRGLHFLALGLVYPVAQVIELGGQLAADTAEPHVEIEAQGFPPAQRVILILEDEFVGGLATLAHDLYEGTHEGM